MPETVRFSGDNTPNRIGIEASRQLAAIDAVLQENGIALPEGKRYVSIVNADTSTPVELNVNSDPAVDTWNDATQPEAQD